MSEHSAEKDAGRRWGAWAWNLAIDLYEWVVRTEGFTFREFRRLGAEGRREGVHYLRETRVNPPGKEES